NRDYNIAICYLRQAVDICCFQQVMAEVSGFSSWPVVVDRLLGGQEVRRLVTMNCVPTYASMNVVNECSRLVNEEYGRAIIRRMCKLCVLISFIGMLRVCLFGGSAHCQAPSDSPKWHVQKLALEVSDEFLHNDIYIMDPSGSKPRRLVEGISPAWSP